MTPQQLFVPRGQSIQPGQLTAFISRACPPSAYRGKRVLLIVPDATRTAPIGVMFKALYRHLHKLAGGVDVMVALGTHPPMSEEATCERLGITLRERKTLYEPVKFLTHAWNEQGELRQLGQISARDISLLSNGVFAMDVPVQINRNIFDYDILLMVGPVFPHEVVGFSGGNKYLFPGISGPEILNFFHWLGAVATNPMIIGNKWTPVRRIIDKAAAMVPNEKRCFCLVVDGSDLAGITYGEPESAWDVASDLSRERHITVLPKPFQTILSCAPQMYNELWAGGKCMYKLEAVAADGGEIIIYAPHIREISRVHGRIIEEIGYHCRDYFLRKWNQFKGYPWGVLAHSTHVRGIGTYENGVERCRIRVTLATGISRELCERINLGYRDPASINPEDYANREDEGVLLVRQAGEQLYHLETPPAWAKPI